MKISPSDLRLLNSMLEKVNRLLELYATNTVEEINSKFYLSDSVQFEFEKLYEDSERLSSEFKAFQNELHVNDLRAIRNRVAHDYESVSLKILLDTIRDDMPVLKETLEKLIENK